jgi:hypothetical protein
VTMPNFLLIGTPRAGTSSMYRYLREHPQVFMSPVKEPKYFEFAESGFDYTGPGDAKTHEQATTTREAYEALFAEAAGRPAIGEASPVYLFSPRAFEAIRREVPGARIVVILRDPAERAFSNFLHMVKKGREKRTTFWDAVEEGRTGRRDGWDPHWRYFEVGLYHQQVKRYLDAFGRERVLIHLFDDLESDPAEILRRTHEFLGVDSVPLASMAEKYNVGAVPRDNAVHAALYGDGRIKRLARLVLPSGIRRALAGFVARHNVHRPKLPRDDRSRLVRLYRDDVLRLQDLIRRDLSLWLKG